MSGRGPLYGPHPSPPKWPPRPQRPGPPRCIVGAGEPLSSLQGHIGGCFSIRIGSLGSLPDGRRHRRSVWTPPGDVGLGARGCPAVSLRTPPLGRIRGCDPRKRTNALSPLGWHAASGHERQSGHHAGPGGANSFVGSDSGADGGRHTHGGCRCDRPRRTSASLEAIVGSDAHQLVNAVAPRGSTARCSEYAEPNRRPLTPGGGVAIGGPRARCGRGGSAPWSRVAREVRIRARTSVRVRPPLP